MTTPRTGRRRAFVLVATAVLATLGVPSASATGPDRLTISTASNHQARFVSGGDVLVRVTGGDGVRVTRNGRDVTASFTRQPDRALVGLVAGLRDGTNTLVARDGGRRADLKITNHDDDGPVFSGRQQRPFYCETTAFGLAPAQQPLCEAPAVVRYRYRTTAGAFAPLADPSARPADLATATVAGRAVPYVVRVETGVYVLLGVV